MPRDNDEYESSLAFHEIAAKLDTVISGQANLEKGQVKIDANFENLNNRFNSVEEQVGELTRTIRGYNGTPGLVTEVALVKEAIKGDKGKPKVEDSDDGAAHEAKGVLTTNWLMDKAVLPIGIAFILWFLLTILPELLKHVGIGG